LTNTAPSAWFVLRYAVLLEFIRHKKNIASAVVHTLPTSEGKMIAGTPVLPLISDTVHSMPRPPTPTEPPTRTAVVPPAVAPRAIRAASSGGCESGSISVRCIVPSLLIASSRCCSMLNRLTPSFLRLDPEVFITTFPASSRPWRVAGVTPHADFDIKQPFFSFWKTCHQMYLSRR
jgi:hypothetical protein